MDKETEGLLDLLIYWQKRYEGYVEKWDGIGMEISKNHITDIHTKLHNDGYSSNDISMMYRERKRANDNK